VVVPDLLREELFGRELEPDRDPLARDEPAREELLRVLLVRDPLPA
jgi:hypothetical protein